MKKMVKPSTRTVPAKTDQVSTKLRTELKALAKCSEREIDLSDIPATKQLDWKDAKRGQFYRPIKQQITVRIDADVIAWLKDQGTGYQSRLNAILRENMLKTG
jgi:uncharacterized protein (DUF4415 family)